MCSSQMTKDKRQFYVVCRAPKDKEPITFSGVDPVEKSLVEYRAPNSQNEKEYTLCLGGCWPARCALRWPHDVPRLKKSGKAVEAEDQQAIGKAFLADARLSALMSDADRKRLLGAFNPKGTFCRFVCLRFFAWQCASVRKEVSTHYLTTSFHFQPPFSTSNRRQHTCRTHWSGGPCNGGKHIFLSMHRLAKFPEGFWGGKGGRGEAGAV